MFVTVWWANELNDVAQKVNRAPRKFWRGTSAASTLAPFLTIPRKVTKVLTTDFATVLKKMELMVFAALVETTSYDISI
jgi:hypothetical protein